MIFWSSKTVNGKFTNSRIKKVTDAALKMGNRYIVEIERFLKGRISI